MRDVGQTWPAWLASDNWLGTNDMEKSSWPFAIPHKVAGLAACGEYNTSRRRTGMLDLHAAMEWRRRLEALSRWTAGRFGRAANGNKSSHSFALN